MARACTATTSAIVDAWKSGKEWWYWPVASSHPGKIFGRLIAWQCLSFLQYGRRNKAERAGGVAARNIEIALGVRRAKP